jgi:hypothetical protein
VPGGGQFVEQRRGRGPLAARRLLRPRQAHAAEQDVADLLRGAEREGLAGHLVDLVFEARERLGEVAGQPAQDVAVDLDAAQLHAAQNLDQAALQNLVDREPPLRDEAGLEEPPEAERHVHVLRGVGRGLVDRDPVEGDLGPPGASDVGEADRGVAEMAAGELVHAVAAATRVEHVGHQHGVVVGSDLDPVPLHDHPVELQVLPDLQDRAVL